MHNITTIQQNSTVFLHLQIEIKKRNPQNCKQVFINASRYAKNFYGEKGKTADFLLTKNKNMI